MNERIKELRRALDLTQQAFAEKMGTTRNNIAGYEVGRRSPSEAVISLMCKTFNVSEEWLRTGKGDIFLPAPSNSLDALAQEYHLDQFGRTVIEKMVNLNEKQWEMLYDIVTDIVAEFSKESLSPAPVQPDDDIEASVEAYRRQLLDEKEREAKSSASPDISEDAGKMA